MASTALQYGDFLKIKLRVLEDIRKNTAEQSDALESLNYDLLGKLLEKRQRQIAELDRIAQSLKACAGMVKDAETKSMEQYIGLLIQEINDTNDLNIKKVESLRYDTAGKLKSLKLGKSALQNGYFKRMPQRYGYFIDKKVGK